MIPTNPSVQSVDSLSDAELDALQALYNAATPGVWGSKPKDGKGKECTFKRVFWEMGQVAPPNKGIAYIFGDTQVNADFVTAAHNAFPRLLQAAIRALELEQRVKQLHAWLNDACIVAGLGPVSESLDIATCNVLAHQIKTISENSVRFYERLEKAVQERDAFTRRCIEYTIRCIADDNDVENYDNHIDEILAAVHAEMRKQELP